MYYGRVMYQQCVLKLSRCAQLLPLSKQAAASNSAVPVNRAFIGTSGRSLCEQQLKKHEKRSRQAAASSRTVPVNRSLIGASGRIFGEQQLKKHEKKFTDKLFPGEVDATDETNSRTHLGLKVFWTLDSYESKSINFFGALRLVRVVVFGSIARNSIRRYIENYSSKK